LEHTCVHCQSKIDVKEYWFDNGKIKYTKLLCKACMDSWLGKQRMLSEHLKVLLDKINKP